MLYNIQNQVDGEAVHSFKNNYKKLVPQYRKKSHAQTGRLFFRYCNGIGKEILLTHTHRYTRNCYQVYLPNFLQNNWSTIFLSFVILAYHSSFTIISGENKDFTKIVNIPRAILYFLRKLHFTLPSIPSWRMNHFSRGKGQRKDAFAKCIYKQ